MSDREVICSDLADRCCDSCHDDEDDGYDTLKRDTWLYTCCAGVVALREAGVDSFDEAAVRAFAESRQS